jgi:hypothetical protein
MAIVGGIVLFVAKQQPKKQPNKQRSKQANTLKVASLFYQQRCEPPSHTFQPRQPDNCSSLLFGFLFCTCLQLKRNRMSPGPRGRAAEQFVFLFGFVVCLLFCCLFFVLFFFV